MASIPALLQADDAFPDASLALTDPDGLLAIGGDLSSKRLIDAYRHGIFFCYSEDQPILWLSPNPRALLYPNEIKISRSLHKTLKKRDYQVSFDHDFTAVIEQCSAPRDQQDGTWITAEMKFAYQQLHRLGIAHSVEVWQQDKLIGGLYGLAIGSAFFGESMFSKQTDGSKIALVYLAGQLRQWHYDFIDCQLPNPHLSRMGAVEVPRDSFLRQLQQALAKPAEHDWQFTWCYQ